MTAQHTSETNQLDQYAIRRIAERVIAGLLAEKNPAVVATPSSSSRTDRSATLIESKVVSADQLIRLSRNHAIALIRHDAVVTPAAKDEAKSRGIQITRIEKASTAGTAKTGEKAEPHLPIIDQQQPKRAQAIAIQLLKRGIKHQPPRIILSDTPAKSLHHEISNGGEVAVMIGAIEEVARFSKELSVTTWVLDMKRLSFIQAVNVSAAIARTGGLKS